MQTIAIKQALDVLAESSSQLVAMGQLPDGEILQFARLYAFLAWYCTEYVETGRV